MVRNIHFILMLKVQTTPEGSGVSDPPTDPPNGGGIRMSHSSPGHFAAHRAGSEPAALLLLLFISMLYKYSIGLCVRSFLML